MGVSGLIHWWVRFELVESKPLDYHNSVGTNVLSGIVWSYSHCNEMVRSTGWYLGKGVAHK